MRLALACLLCAAVGCAQAAESLCTSAERVVFSCHVAHSIVSLCGSSHSLAYRYGRPGHVELTHPGRRPGERSAFFRTEEPLYGGGVTTVAFTRGNYEYRVYSKVGRSEAPTPEERVPIFEDGLIVLRRGKEVLHRACDDGGAGFRESIDWIPERQDRGSRIDDSANAKGAKQN